MRISKTPDERRIEIIETANRLFEERGFNNTTISAITKEMNVAKGTFYYYFSSKDDVIEAIVNHALKDIVEKANLLVQANERTPLDKLTMILAGSLNSEKTVKVREKLHKPNNRELHEKMNVASIKVLTPIIGEIIHQGNENDTFHVADVEVTVGFLMTGIQFYLDEVLFGWSDKEINSKRKGMFTIIERCLGMKEGTLK